jgi:hypothetical protein
MGERPGGVLRRVVCVWLRAFYVAAVWEAPEDVGTVVV